MNYLGRQTQAFEKIAADAYLDTAKKNVHLLRVTTRRIRSVLWLVEHADPNFTFKKLSSSLQKIGQALGKCRELDVVLQDCAAYPLKVKKLKFERRSARKKLLPLLCPKEQKKIAGELEKTLGKLQTHPEIDLLPAIAQLRTKLNPWLQRKNISEAKMHELRITIKKIRYAFEALKISVDPLRKLQDFLGKFHDLEVLDLYLKKNKKVQTQIATQYQQTKPAIKPALQFAKKQLDVKINGNGAHRSKARKAS